MEENKDLTPEDKVRIEQEAAKLFNRWDGGLVNVQTMLLSIAEYATLFERQQHDAESERWAELHRNDGHEIDRLEAERSEVNGKVARLEAAVWMLLHHVPDTPDMEPIREKCKAELNSLKTK